MHAADLGYEYHWAGQEEGLKVTVEGHLVSFKHLQSSVHGLDKDKVLAWGGGGNWKIYEKKKKAKMKKMSINNIGTNHK